MTARQAARTALQGASDPLALLRAAGPALQHGLASELEPRLSAAAAAQSDDARLWQFLGLARRDLQDSAGAHAAFVRAAQLVPADPLIAHSQARTALEAGFPAVALFNRARQLAPADGAVALGRFAALFAAGEGETACDQCAAMLAQNPGWSEGHVAHARLSAQVRLDQPIDGPLRAALRQHPQAGALWSVLMQVWTEARDYRAVAAIVAEARTALGPGPELDRIEAICLTELGEPDQAQALFDRVPPPQDGDAACWPIRNLIRLGRRRGAGSCRAGLRRPQ